MGYLAICKCNYGAKFAAVGDVELENASGLGKNNTRLCSLPFFLLRKRVTWMSAGGTISVHFRTISGEISSDA
jgi:hypothetical protein